MSADYKVGDIISSDTKSYWVVVSKYIESTSIINTETKRIYTRVPDSYLQHYRYKVASYHEALTNLNLNKFPEHWLPYLRQQIEYEDVDGF